ncbi:MAG: methionyl-tRNA formyltransferase [Haliea sp.]|jgi:methionyl-tRNA formyltransferase|uniref:methionyl-tRNA formyltransferase n=1 Tax=Haliea sp. TaxID=1932666 RepID=UPI000C38F9B2|nr:methionyl-tRNA formyltransferase [Haliea sp.]MBM69008.1 methionyl-tRNA formyltransferase [Haliea sp.]|tara:strand:+ start:12904 stop:13878 length:975 start_codon:yes stop_codon:yes gene_type:complete
MANAPLRVLFAGTPDFAAHHLQALLDSPHQVVGVYTQPDRPAGRGKKLQASPVKQLALQAGLPLRQPVSLRTPETQAELAAFAADVMVVVAYGLILPQVILDAPRWGCLNVHASLLPRWRGAAPIQRAIQAGDTESGVTIMQMDAGLDTGAMLATARCPIDSATSAAVLHDRLAELGPPLLLQVLNDLPGYLQAGVAQDDSLATYARKIEKAEGALDWRQSAAELARQVAAFNPFPVCFAVLNGERVRIWTASAVSEATHAAPGTILSADREGVQVACGNGSLRLLTLQLPGGRALPAADLLNAQSAQFAPGACFQPAAEAATS